MPSFSSFNHRLPDPTFYVSDAGTVSNTGSTGPGFASVSVVSSRPAQVSRTVSGRGIHRESGAHNWEINISYHPMLRDDFDVVSSFLDMRNGRLNPFFVVLPQNSRPRDPIFSAFATSNAFYTAGSHVAGSPSILMEAGTSLVGTPKPGDFFTVSDPNNITHLKTYKVTAVETNQNYHEDSPQPTTSQVRVHTLPPMTKFVADESVINWIDPAFRVIQKSDVQEYNLNTDNLYSYQLSLEEIQP